MDLLQVHNSVLVDFYDYISGFQMVNSLDN